MDERLIQTNGIQIHALDRPGDEPALVLLPGLTANARCFDGLLAAGLGAGRRALALDLRGRGLSDQPDDGYTLDDHAADLIGLLDALGLARVVLVGHSFGGLLTLCVAARFPARVDRAVLIDAALGVTNPRTYELIKPSIDRLGQTYPSWPSYLATMRGAAVYAGWWDPAIESYYRADVRDNPDGTVTPYTRPETIAAVIQGSAGQDYPAYAAAMRCPALLVRAAGSYGPPGAPPIVSDAQVEATRAALPGIGYAEVPGNHITMLYGAGAQQTVAAVDAFLRA